MNQQNLDGRNHRNRFASLGAALVMTGLTAGLALGLAGCDEDAEASAKLTEASQLMAAINAGGGESANAPHREATYDKVIGMLRPVVSGSNASLKGSAQLLTAQALAGKGRIETTSAVRLENRCAALISAAHNQADLFASHSALSSALVAYDAQPEFDDLDAQSRSVNDEIDEVRNRIRGIDERVSQLQQRADAAREEAASRHRHETELRSEAVHVSADERQKLIAQAVEYQREADKFEAEYVMVEAGVEQLRKTRESVQADLDRLSTQRTLLEEAQRNAQLRAQVASDESSSAENKAFDAARALRNTVREIEELRAGELADAYTTAASTLDSAASTLLSGARSDASREAKDANSVNEGLIRQALGDLHSAQATGAAAYASLLQRLTGMDPLPPESGDYRSYLSRVRTEVGEARASARDTYTQAADTLERAGGSDAMRERLGRIVTALRGDASEEAPLDDEGAFDEDPEG